MTVEIPAAAEDWIGREVGAHTLEVTRPDVRKFAHALRLTDPVHFDVDAARARGWRDLLAPRMFYLVCRTAAYTIAPLHEFKRDGLQDEDMPELPLNRRMAGRSAVHFRRPIVAGDEITVHKSLADLSTREGRSGPLIFVEFDYRYVDQDGAEVASERLVRILR